MGRLGQIFEVLCRCSSTIRHKSKDTFKVASGDTYSTNA